MSERMRTLKIVGSGGLFVSLLISVSWFMAFGTISAGQDTPQSPKETNLRSGVWSDPSIWGNLRVPRPGELVTIAEGTTVTYDLFSQAEIAALHINGSLIFSQDVGLLCRDGFEAHEPQYQAQQRNKNSA